MDGEEVEVDYSGKRVTVCESGPVIRVTDKETGAWTETRGTIPGGLACFPYAAAVERARRVAYERERKGRAAE